MRARWLLVIVLALLAISAQPAAAANASAVASEHTTFGTGSQGEPSPTQLTNANIQGSGPSASVVAGGTVSYNPVDDQGNGEADITGDLVGDDGGNSNTQSEIRIEPTESGSISSIAPNIKDTYGSDYGATVDIYITQEAGPDGVYGEGTLVKSGWDPDWTTGSQQITISEYDVQGGSTYSIEFVTTSSDNDDTFDGITIGVDTSASSDWFSSGGSPKPRYGDLDVTIQKPLSVATYVGAAHSANAYSAFTNVTLQNADATLTWQEDGDGDGTWTNVTSTTVSSSGNYTEDLSGTASDQWRVRIDIAATGADPTVEIHDEGLLFESSEPSLSDPEPPDGMQIANATGDVSINVSDADFPLAQGDSVTVSATDGNGNSLGSATLTSNETASFSYSSMAGENTIQWTATDAYGNSDTFTQTYSTPATLTLYNESSPEQKIQTNANITATFFGSNGETVVQRTSSDATFNFSGLPADTEYIVTVDAEGYRERTLVIRSLYEQQSFYLLSNNVSASQIVFELSDPTGEFPPGETRLFIEKPLKINNTTSYRTIAADTFGATSAYSVVLAENARYRLRIRHDGQERILGSYTPTVPTTETLRVQRIEPSAEDVPQGAVYGSVEDGQLAVRFRGSANDTTVSYTVRDENGTVVVPETQTTGTSFAHVYPANNSTTYNVSYQISYADGGSASGSFTAGGVAGITGRFNMDGQLLSLLSWGAILATLGLVVIVDTRLAPAAGTGVASALTIIGTIAIPAPLLGVSGVVAVLALFGRPS